MRGGNYVAVLKTLNFNSCAESAQEQHILCKIRHIYSKSNINRPNNNNNNNNVLIESGHCATTLVF